MSKRKIVILNQAANYLTVDLCNEFSKVLDEVVLVTGSVHEQGEVLNCKIKIDPIIKWKEQHDIEKVLIYLRALLTMWSKLIFRYRNYEVLFISVPPMAYLMNIILPHRFSMIIWDIYPDVLKITGMDEKHFVYKTWSFLNKKSFKKAFKVFTVGEVMRQALSQYMDTEKIKIQPIWSIFQSNLRIDKDSNLFLKDHDLNDYFIVQYSGNIGLTHSVEVMLELAESLKEYDRILFQIIGRGPRKKFLENIVLEKGLSNCQFLPFQTDEMFPHSLSSAKVGVVILDERIPMGSIPSKSYNLMAFGIPSLYIAPDNSELAVYANKYGHAKCYNQSDLKGMQEFVLSLYLDPGKWKEMGLKT